MQRCAIKLRCPSIAEAEGGLVVDDKSGVSLLVLGASGAHAALLAP